MRDLQIRPLLGIGLLALLGSAGCSDDPLQSCTIPAGRIEGFVRLGVTPVRASVRATLVADRPGDAAWFDAQVASDGSYALDLPAGRYVLGLMMTSQTRVDYEFSAAGPTDGEPPPDTLLVDAAHSPIAADFDLASLQVHLDLSPDLDGETALVILHRVDRPRPAGTRAYLYERGAEIRNGVADVLAHGVLPGTYRIEIVIGRRVYQCDCPWDGEHFWLPGVRDPDASPPVEIPRDQFVTAAGGVGATPARIQGRITGVWQDFGLEAPSLGLFALDSTIVRGQRRVNDDGSFDERIYLPAPVKLLVMHDGVSQWIGGPTFGNAAVFDLQPGQLVSGVQLVESGALVQVTAEAYSLVFMNLEFYDAGDMSLVAEWKAPYAPSPAVFGVPNLRPGSYRVHVDFQLRGYSRWKPQWYDRASDPSDARIVTVGGEGEVVRIPLVMQKGGTITGTIGGPGYQDGDYMVYVTQADDPSGWSQRSVLTGHRSFTVEGLPDGKWKVGACVRGTNDPDSPTPAPGTVWYPSTTDWRSAHVVTIRESEDVTGIDIYLPAARR